MSDKNENTRREPIGNFYEKHKSLRKKFTVNHFLIEGVCEKTIYNTINRVENGQSLQRKCGSGYNVKKVTQKKRLGKNSQATNLHES